jgi:hypothetical protein
MAPLASTTCHLRWSKFFFGKYVFIKNPSQGAENLPNRRAKSTGKKKKNLKLSNDKICFNQTADARKAACQIAHRFALTIQVMFLIFPQLIKPFF